jgi:hypothetical protein
MSSQRLMHQVFVRLLAAAAIAAPTGGAAIENRPTLELFPMPALETLRETARSAQSLETGLEGLLRDMDLQFQVFEASHCRGAVDDASCQEIEKGLRKTYQQVLDRMIDALPEMERLVGSTRRNLSGTLRSQIGMNLSPRDLQRVVGEKPGSESAARQRTGARVGRLSQHFQPRQPRSPRVDPSRPAGHAVGAHRTRYLEHLGQSKPADDGNRSSGQRPPVRRGPCAARRSRPRDCDRGRQHSGA